MDDISSKTIIDMSKNLLGITLRVRALNLHCAPCKVVSKNIRKGHHANFTSIVIILANSFLENIIQTVTQKLGLLLVFYHKQALNP